MTDIEKITAPSRRLTEVEYKEPPKPEPQKSYFMFPLLTDQYRSLQIPVTSDMDDISLERFLNTVADPKDFTRTISNMVRINERDYLHDKTKTREWLYWFEEWKGYDKQGHTIPSVTKAQGFDYQIHYSTDRDSSGNIIHKEQDKYKVFLIPFSIENFEKAIEQAPDTDVTKVGYMCQDYRSWGGYSFEEFKYLPFRELAERGRKGNVKEPVNPELMVSHKKSKTK